MRLHTSSFRFTHCYIYFYFHGVIKGLELEYVGVTLVISSLLTQENSNWVLSIFQVDKVGPVLISESFHHFLLSKYFLLPIFGLICLLFDESFFLLGHNKALHKTHPEISPNKLRGDIIINKYLFSTSASFGYSVARTLALFLTTQPSLTLCNQLEIYRFIDSFRFL